MVVGLIGCGQWGAHVLRDLRSLGCNVPVVARSDVSVARARKGGAATVVPRMAELGTVDALVVVTPIATHAAVVSEALELDVPVFVEKPLCDGVENAERLAELAPGRLFVMDKWRYHPGVRLLAEIAETERLGRTHGLRTIRVQPDNRHQEDAVWVLAPHDLAIALEVLGEVPRAVAAAGSWTGERLVTLHALLESDRGWHVAEMSERAAVVERRVELHCDDGLAVLAGGWDEHVAVHMPDGRTERIEAQGELPLLAELRAFVDHVAGGPPPKSSVSEGAEVVRTIVALRRLAR
jgi:predicted dehydrogenase